MIQRIDMHIKCKNRVEKQSRKTESVSRRTDWKMRLKSRELADVGRNGTRDSIPLFRPLSPASFRLLFLLDFTRSISMMICSFSTGCVLEDT